MFRGENHAALTCTAEEQMPSSKPPPPNYCMKPCLGLTIWLRYQVSSSGQAQSGAGGWGLGWGWGGGRDRVPLFLAACVLDR